MRRRNVILGVAALCGFGPAGFAQVSLSDRLSGTSPPLVIAHRTAQMGDAPENSLLWIQYGIDRGADMLHINMQLTADGGYILMHDPTLNRTTDVESIYPKGPPGGPSRAARGGKDYVRDYTRDQIARLRLADGAGGYALPVPTLDQALSLAQGRVLLALGLKTYEVDSLAPVLQRHDPSNLMLFQLYVSGTDQGQLRDLAQRTGVPVGAVLYRSRDYAADLAGLQAQLPGALRIVFVRSRGLTPDFVAQARSAGVTLAVSGWSSGEDFALTENGDPQPWQRVLDQGLSVLTSRPDDLLDLMGR
ncbi:glycerophosphodiester phosphodiesterase [Antarctobacter jejuensis]|uniref:glycerophosphodiester phosphodiesterase n=1 Tax=Antarctobacter jejuensis TaxID=1439938 RepID=UPI003FD51DF8